MGFGKGSTALGGGGTTLGGDTTLGGCTSGPALGGGGTTIGGGTTLSFALHEKNGMRLKGGSGDLG
eukprot:9057490-Alexandrium_andersonii.AAC.1